MKRIVLLLTVVAVMPAMMAAAVPAMATVCQPTDVDCVEPPADTPSNTPPGPQLQYADPNSTDPGNIEISPSDTFTCSQQVGSPDPLVPIYGPFGTVVGYVPPGVNVSDSDYNPCLDAAYNGNA